MGFTVIFEKGPKPNGRNTVIGAAMYTCQVGADFRFKDFSGNLYKVGELDGETERTVASLNHFSPKRTLRCSMSKIARLRTPSVEGDICFWAGKTVLSGMRGRIAHSRKEALELAIFTPPPRMLPDLTRSPSRLACVWCVATQAEWDAAVGCIAVSISPYWAFDSAFSRRRLEYSLF